MPPAMINEDESTNSDDDSVDLGLRWEHVRVVAVYKQVEDWLVS